MSLIKNRKILIGIAALLLFFAAAYVLILLKATQWQSDGSRPNEKVLGKVESIYLRGMSQLCTGVVTTPQATWLIGGVEGNWAMSQAADRIPLLLDGFDRQFLAQSGELKSLDRPELVSYLAECHVEFILIHPFREGNGRLSRLLCDMLAVLAGKGLLDYSLWDEHKAFYFKAIQAGVSGNYSPMMQLVSDILPD
ncbi:Fic family protein [Serratia entomophila]|uniref:Fic family protein n=1 Tax=Serratia entomophila TaxID=42906 RepID=UPI00217C3DF4|nr:Fic family protein [Serratia entomophila]CAI1074623.1 cell filamentation protein Fic [Serratia entomophila]CAI1738973.1 cell filamentation protein Fic [Serratia entomophila]CAI1759624.1 cell filamentation protein Fic [Serratia entomophila]CAI1812152.1 cell filamentation protein Fic [Serratia entomophila]CAI1856966.1 cell filamentation protein Fic [Serratia entomophila]